MSDHEQDRRLDALLDSMLLEYSAVEPRPGIELRIRARLKTHAAQRRRRLALVFAASSAVIIAAIVARTSIDRHEPVYQVTQRTNAPQAHPVSPAVNIVRTAHPAPKAPEENTAPDRTKALLQLAQATDGNNGLSPENELPAVAAEPAEPAAPEPEPSSTQPISIQKLSVDSLEIKELAPTRDDEKGNL